MDIHRDLIKWLRTMGYDGDIPESLVGICNNSTKFIWEDLMLNVRPKQEVDTIRKNIIFNRLKTKPHTKQDDYAYKIQEIETYRQKLALQEKVQLVKNMVQEKQYKVDKLSKNCKIKTLSAEYLKKKIQENNERKYILELKRKQLEKQNCEAVETLTKLKNVTPVEREERSTTKEITETLEKCAKKLTKILADNQKTLTQNIQKNQNVFPVTQTKTARCQSLVATYLSIREKEDSEEITRSCIKKPKDKENVPSNKQHCKNFDSKKRLFEVPQILVEAFEKSSFEKISVSSSIESNQIGLNDSFIKPKTRESLGILSDSFLCDEDKDSFLQCSDIHTPDEVFAKSDARVYSFMSINSHPSYNSSDSVVFNSNKPKDKDFKKVVSSQTHEYCKKKLYGDISVSRQLENLLHSNNRELLYEILQKLMQNIKVDFTKMVSVESTEETQTMVNEDDITKLRFIHLQKELQIVQQKRILKDLVAKVGRSKLNALSTIRAREDITALQSLLDTSIKQVGLDASLAAIKKEVNSSKNLDNDENELQVLSSRILKAKSEIGCKVKLIHLTIDELYNTQNFLTSTRESVLGPIWNIRVFKTEMDWMNPLLENLWSEEIQVFADFPLNYQRKCIHTDGKTYYRDLCIDTYSQDSKMEPNDLQMVCEILENPIGLPETILLNILKAKMKMEVLKKYRNKNLKTSDEQFDKKYCLEDLRKQESYLEYSVDRLKSIWFSSKASNTLAVKDVIKHTVDIWTEMPMRHFVSEKREVHGQKYRAYQDKLNCFL